MQYTSYRFPSSTPAAPVVSAPVDLSTWNYTLRPSTHVFGYKEGVTPLPIWTMLAFNDTERMLQYGPLNGVLAQCVCGVWEPGVWRGVGVTPVSMHLDNAGLQ